MRVLGVRGGGMEETLLGEEPLILADSEEPQDLARAVRTILSLEEGPEARRRRRQRILDGFSLEACFTKLFFLYAQILNLTETHGPACSIECR